MFSKVNLQIKLFGSFGVITTIILIVSTGSYCSISKLSSYINECYAGQLNQVFMNILANAIDTLEEYNCDRSQISISTDINTQNQVKIVIADNGSGMPESVRQRVFDPFHTTKPVGKGTGLGLSISYQIITVKHGGTLECYSTLQQRTQFIIQIPANVG